MMTFERLLKENYQKRKDKDYLFQKADGVYESISFGNFVENTLLLAEALIKLGLQGKKIIVFGENSIEWMMSDLAIMSCVGVSVGLGKDYREDDIVPIIELVQAQAIIYSESKTDIVDRIGKSIKNLKLLSMEKDLPRLLSEERRRNTWWIEHLFRSLGRDHEECIKVVFTSGTTAFPKAVMLSEKNIFAGWASLQKRTPMDETDRCYLFLPLSHTYGGIYNFIYSLISGMQIYLSSGTQHIESELKEVQPTVFCAVPVIYRSFYDKTEGKLECPANLFGKNIKYLFCGGAHLEEEIRYAYRRAGLNLLVAYALSETASSLSIEYSGSDNRTSVGVIFEDMDVKIYRPDENGQGEILVKGNAVFLGYMNDDKSTRVAFDLEGYFKTGDLGRIDKDRNLYLTGRKDKTIIRDKERRLLKEH